MSGAPGTFRAERDAGLLMELTVDYSAFLKSLLAVLEEANWHLARRSSRRINCAHVGVRCLQPGGKETRGWNSRSARAGEHMATCPHAGAAFRLEPGHSVGPRGEVQPPFLSVASGRGRSRTCMQGCSRGASLIGSGQREGSRA